MNKTEYEALVQKVEAHEEAVDAHLTALLALRAREKRDRARANEWCDAADIMDWQETQSEMKRQLQALLALYADAE